MYEFSDFKKIDMHSHIGTWGNPFNFSGDINLVIDLINLILKKPSYAIRFF